MMMISGAVSADFSSEASAGTKSKDSIFLTAIWIYIWIKYQDTERLPVDILYLA